MRVWALHTGSLSEFKPLRQAKSKSEPPGVDGNAPCRQAGESNESRPALSPAVPPSWLLFGETNPQVPTVYSASVLSMDQHGEDESKIPMCFMRCARDLPGCPVFIAGLPGTCDANAQGGLGPGRGQPPPWSAWWWQYGNWILLLGDREAQQKCRSAAKVCGLGAPLAHHLVTLVGGRRRSISVSWTGRGLQVIGGWLEDGWCWACLALLSGPGGASASVTARWRRRPKVRG